MMAVSLHYDRDSFRILCMATIALYHRCHRLLARIPLIQAVSRVVQCSFSLKMIKLVVALEIIRVNHLNPNPSPMCLSQGCLRQSEAVYL